MNLNMLYVEVTLIKILYTQNRLYTGSFTVPGLSRVLSLKISDPRSECETMPEDLQAK
jgi:hypothetical protein